MTNMELKNRPVQLDLFARGREEGPRRSSFFERLSSQIILSLENTIIIAIFISLAVLLAFSLGVEKGKRQTQKELNLRFDVAGSEKKPELKPIKTNIRESLPEKADVKESFKIKPAENSNKYTIQVASFKKESSVRQEESRLKSRGYQTIVKTSGEFLALCVGTFNDKQEAAAVKRQLITTYEDCFVRRL